MIRRQHTTSRLLSLVFCSALLLMGACSDEDDSDDSSASDTSTMRDAPPPGGDTMGGGGDDTGGGGPNPPPECTDTSECDGACPEGSLDCVCAPGPPDSGIMICVPTCTTNEDCPANEPELTCNTDSGHCRPAGGPPGGGGGP